MAKVAARSISGLSVATNAEISRAKPVGQQIRDRVYPALRQSAVAAYNADVSAGYLIRFEDYLSTAAAGCNDRAGFFGFAFRMSDYGDCLDVKIASRVGVGHRDGFGANGEAVRGVFEIRTDV